MRYGDYKDRSSFHFFMYPFVFKNKKDITPFIECLSTTGNWIPSSQEESDDNIYETYATRKYFNEEARKLIYGEENNRPEGELPIIQSFHFKKAEEGKLSFIYRKETYLLEMMQVELNLYEDGAGILLFRFAAPKGVRFSPEDICSINQSLRRVFPAFYPDKTEDSLNPEKILIEFGKERLDVAYKVSKQDRFKAVSPDKYEHETPDLIHTFLAYQMSEQTRGKMDSMERKLILDDRMHVMCLIRNQKLSEEISKYDEAKEEYMIYSDEALSSRVYELCYVDDPGALSCQNRRMKKELLENSIYDRWIDYGTIYGVTHHSMIGITSEDSWDAVVKPFITMYTKMQMIVLLQRISIRYYANQVSEHSSLIKTIDEKDITLEDEEQIQIVNLQQNFLKSKNHVLLDEVTTAEQGIELYAMMQREMYIDREVDRVERKIEDLQQLALVEYERKNSKETEGMNSVINNLTVWSIPLASFALIASALQTDTGWVNGSIQSWILSLKPQGWISLGITIFFIAVSINYSIKSYKMKKKLNKNTKQNIDQTNSNKPKP